MTQEIQKRDWKSFFDDLSKRRFEWRTKVEVTGSDIGHQTLTDKLPLNGIAVEESKGKTLVEIIVGYDEDNHQTHTLVDPLSVHYKGDDDELGGIVEIGESDGTKTMVHIIEPLPFKIGALRAQGIAKSE